MRLNANKITENNLWLIKIAMYLIGFVNENAERESENFGKRVKTMRPVKVMITDKSATTR